jgi:hypothetical protein
MLAVPELAVVALGICFIVEKAFKIHLDENHRSNSDICAA